MVVNVYKLYKPEVSNKAISLERACVSVCVLKLWLLILGYFMDCSFEHCSANQISDLKIFNLLPILGNVDRILHFVDQ